MTGTTVLALEGVLAGRYDEPVDLTQSTLELSGATLYGALATTSKVVLATNLDRRLVAHWCRSNGLTQHTTTVALDGRTVTALRAGGENVVLYVDADPERVAAALRAGVVTMLYARPLYARGTVPSHSQSIRPWAELVAESRAQRAARVSPLATATE